MPLRPKIAGDCHSAVPYEFPDEKAKASQNFKNVLRMLGNIICRLEALENVDICELLCECPPCPIGDLPELEPVAFDGQPWENIYADGLNYIGNISTGVGAAAINYRIFDPVNGKEVAQLGRTDGDGTVWAGARGYGADWHVNRNEVWITGVLDGGNTASLRVYDASEMQGTRDPEAAFLVQYDYLDYSFSGPGAAVTVCPATGHVYAGMKKAGVSVTVIDPETGSVLANLRAADTPDWPFESQVVVSITWHPGINRMIAQLEKDEQWTIHPGTFAVSQLSGAVGGIISTGFHIPRNRYGGDGFIYLAPNKYGDLYRFADPAVFTPANSSGGHSNMPGVWVGTSGKRASACSTVPESRVVILSRGDDSLIFSDPDNRGIVEVYTTDKGKIATFEPSFNPARTAYCYNAHTISVCPWWDQDTEWFVQFFRVGDLFPPPVTSLPETERPEDAPLAEEQEEGPGPGSEEELEPVGGSDPDPDDDSGWAPGVKIVSYECEYTQNAEQLWTFAYTKVNLNIHRTLDENGNPKEGNPFATDDIWLFFMDPGKHPDTDEPAHWFFHNGQAIVRRLHGPYQKMVGFVSYNPGTATQPVCAGGTHQIAWDIYAKHDREFRSATGEGFSAWGGPFLIRRNHATDGTSQSP